MMEATLNGKILVDHKINLNEPIGGDGRILLDIISKDDDLNDSSWYIDTEPFYNVGAGVVSIEKIYVVDGQYNNHNYYNYKLWVKVGNLKSSTYFILGNVNVNRDLLKIDILPQIIK